MGLAELLKVEPARTAKKCAKLLMQRDFARLEDKLLHIEPKRRIEVVNHIDDDGYNLLLRAIEIRSEPAIDLVILHGGKVNHVTPKGTPLQWTIQCGYVEAISQLVSRKADVHLVCETGCVLQSAIQHNHERALEWLVHLHRVNINQYVGNMCILQWAIKRENTWPPRGEPGPRSTIRMLVQYGANPLLCDGEGNTSIHSALCRGADYQLFLAQMFELLRDTFKIWEGRLKFTTLVDGNEEFEEFLVRVFRPETDQKGPRSAPLNMRMWLFSAKSPADLKARLTLSGTQLTRTSEKTADLEFDRQDKQVLGDLFTKDIDGKLCVEVQGLDAGPGDDNQDEDKGEDEDDEQEDLREQYNMFGEAMFNQFCTILESGLEPVLTRMRHHAQLANQDPYANYHY